MELYKPSTGSIPGVSRNPPRSERCAVGVWRRMGMASDYGQCAGPAKYDAEIEGRRVKVCATHRPEAKAAREAKAAERNLAYQAAQARKFKRPFEYVTALRLIANGHNDPRALATEVLAKWGDLGPR